MNYDNFEPKKDEQDNLDILPDEPVINESGPVVGELKGEQLQDFRQAIQDALED